MFYELTQNNEDLHLRRSFNNIPTNNNSISRFEQKTLDDLSRMGVK
jgi:hypothetical protein